MSKYTTEIRFLCESLAGYDESQGGRKVNEIIENAAPKIFDFDFPIFDESYRLPLEVKILRHYYTREICEETVALWKLRLEDKLNLIMPYYNKLYESELLEFNPLYNVDLTTDHIRDNSGEVNKTNEVNTSDVNIGSRTSEQNSITDTSSFGDESENKNGSVVVENQETQTSSDTVSGESSTNTNDTTIGQSNENANDSKTENRNRIKNGEESEQTNNSLISDGDSVTTDDKQTATNNENWKLYSDTPQGGVDGLNNATDSIASNAYLTNATKTTDNGEANESSNGSTITHQEQSGDGNRNLEKNENEIENAENNSTREIQRTDSSEKNGFSSTNTENVSSGEKKTEGTNEQTVTENGTKNTSNFANTETNAKDNVNSTDERNVNTSEVGTDTITNLEQYLEHVRGKTPGVSFSKMLMEFRETFLNIDALIIEELNTLFFGLW